VAEAAPITLREERKVVSALFADLVSEQADHLVEVLRVVAFELFGRRYVKPWVHGWRECGKSSSSFADLVVGPESPRA
jgi:hypothetical protein